MYLQIILLPYEVSKITETRFRLSIFYVFSVPKGNIYRFCFISKVTGPNTKITSPATTNATTPSKLSVHNGSNPQASAVVPTNKPTTAAPKVRFVIDAQCKKHLLTLSPLIF